MGSEVVASAGHSLFHPLLENETAHLEGGVHGDCAGHHGPAHRHEGGDVLRVGDCGHGHGVPPDDGNQRKLKIAVYCAVFFMLVEVCGGVMANSLAIITDAAHMLSDVGGFIISLVALQVSTMEVTHEYSYGFKQAEVLGALLSIALVWGLTAMLLMEAFRRFINPVAVDAPVMLAISIMGFVVNLFLMRVLGHEHGHEHGNEAHGSHANDSIAVKAAIAHVIGDLVQSLGVCLAAVCIWWQPFDLGTTQSGISKWNYVDPCCTVLFGILVLLTTKSTLSFAIHTLLVKVPKSVDQGLLAAKLLQIDSVVSVHDLHVWALGSSDVLCTCHIVVLKKERFTEVLTEAIHISQEMGIEHSTFQLEHYNEFDPSIESYGSLLCGKDH